MKDQLPVGAVGFDLPARNRKIYTGEFRKIRIGVDINSTEAECGIYLTRRGILGLHALVGIKLKDDDISKLLSFVLRHQPEALKVDMDQNGWVNVNQLIENLRTLKEISISIDDLIRIVATSNKQRFILAQENTKIRANQGHSLAVDLQLNEATPPELLFHGTATRFLKEIQVWGLKSMGRQYVHLSDNKETAIEVGKRHGNPIVLEIDADRMVHDGIKFLISNNDIWLVESVPIKYIMLSLFT